ARRGPSPSSDGAFPGGSTGRRFRSRNGCQNQPADAGGAERRGAREDGGGEALVASTMAHAWTPRWPLGWRVLGLHVGAIVEGPWPPRGWGLDSTLAPRGGPVARAWPRQAARRSALRAPGCAGLGKVVEDRRTPSGLRSDPPPGG